MAMIYDFSEMFRSFAQTAIPLTGLVRMWNSMTATSLSSRCSLLKANFQLSFCTCKYRYVIINNAASPDQSTRHVIIYG